jgi:2-dehydropantoate 2-reductase
VNFRPRVCVIGAGTIGGLLAAHLARSAEVSVLTRRPEHASALESHGLRISGKADFVSRLRASDEIASIEEPEFVILACKGIDLQQAAMRIEGCFPRATVLTIQNGLGAEEIVREHGDWTLISGFTFMSGTRHSDTHVEYVLDTPTWIGPHEGTDFARVIDVARLLSDSGLKVIALADIEPTRWSKLIFNASVNAVAALTGLPHNEHFARRDTPSDLGHLVYALAQEGCLIAAAIGIEPADDPWQMNVLATSRGASHYPSMLEDIKAGRATEIDLITGALVRAADRTAALAPLHSALYSLVRARESANV